MHLFRFRRPGFTQSQSHGILSGLFGGRCCSSKSLVPTHPSAVGVCNERLRRLEEHFHGQKSFPGTVLAVARRGSVCHVSAAGHRTVGGDPMTDDTIFRVYSLSKIVTSVALMQLYEQGLFQLDEPLFHFLPKFKHANVLTVRDGECSAEPVENPITIRHLLTHTSGLTYGLFDTSEVGDMYTSLGILECAAEGKELAAFADLVAEAPLKFQPGTGFQYGVSTDILGRLIEVLSGLPFNSYLKEHVFHPLGMTDTGFSLTAEGSKRLATLYETGDNGLQKCEVINPCSKPRGIKTLCSIESEPRFLSGGGGLLSTVPDFMRFSLMLAGNGCLGDTRVLSRKTVHLMSQNHLPGGCDLASLGATMPDFYHVRGLGFGLGVAVVLNQEFGLHCSPSSYFWQGLGSTYHFHDPVEDLTVVAMAQFSPVFAPDVFKVRYTLPALATQALVD
eukprot:TRINITY_DN106589_c0_g1_i1.p1 TRINITY_DN106589_c0_g1~~TRINITY_DN106589_c0_g1_i1.p1  ORF type:complete len:447 (+),score=54.68 TRINITY_DN106589_c0_g1_i1:17-1357(+)